MEKLIPKHQNGKPIISLYDDAQYHVDKNGLGYAVRDGKIVGADASVILPNVDVTLNRFNQFDNDSQSVANQFAQEVVQPTLDTMGTMYHYTLGQIPLLGPLSEKAGTVCSIPQLAGTLRSLKAPWNPDNRGFGEYLSIKNPETWNTYGNLVSIPIGSKNVIVLNKGNRNFVKNKGWNIVSDYYKANRYPYNKLPLNYWNMFKHNLGKDNYIRSAHYDNNTFAGYVPAYFDKITKEINGDMNVLFKPNKKFLETHLSTGNKPTQFGKRVYAKFYQQMPEGTYFGSNSKAMSGIRNIQENGVWSELKRIFSENQEPIIEHNYSPDSYMQLLEEARKGRVYKSNSYTHRNQLHANGGDEIPVMSGLGKQLEILVNEAEITGDLTKLNQFLKEHGADKAILKNGKISLPEYVISRKKK